MQIKKRTIVMFIGFLAIVFLLPKLGLAQDWVNNSINDVDTGLGGADIKQIINNIINVFLGFLGIIATLIILYGGFLWMTSKGNPEQITKAKQTIINGVIGLVIIMASYAIASFVMRTLSDVTSNNGGNNTSGSGTYTGGGLGAGILENHYPARNASDIVRNTNIFITFRESINVDDFIITSCNYIDAEYTECVDSDYIRLSYNDTQLDEGDLMVLYDAENKVFELNPFGNSDTTHLESDGNTQYTMTLDNLGTEDGRSVFFSGLYEWDFNVSNELDETPPEVSFVIPSHESTDNPRNSIVQMNFSEAVNPIMATGIRDDAGGNFSNIVLTDGNIIYGQYLISNQYKTVEFNTFDACGENSCGGIVYCLPGTANIHGVITTFIEDMAGNSLADQYNWYFDTNSEIDLTPPAITDRSNSSTFDLEDPIVVVFDKSLLTSSINSENISLYMSNIGDWNFWLGTDTCLSETSCSTCDPDAGDICNNTIKIYHDKFFPTTDYSPVLTSGIKDLRQNCWKPCDLN